LRSLLEQLGIYRALTLQNLFCPKVSQSVLRHYWAELTQSGGILDILQTDTQHPTLLAEDMVTAHPDATPTKICASLGAAILLKHVGTDTLFNLFSRHPRRNVLRLLDETAHHLPRKGTRWSALQTIDKQLADFIPLDFGNAPEGVILGTN
jgi:hypothetical protein